MEYENGFLYYITLQASNQCFYEAKVLEDFDSNYELKMFRPALYYKE